MKKYKVVITQEALSDMKRIYDYIAKDLCAPGTAMGQYERIANGILSLDCFPERFALFDSEPERSYGLRKMTVDHYLICYIIDSNTVTVTDVLYAPSNTHLILSERHS